MPRNGAIAVGLLLAGLAVMWPAGAARPAQLDRCPPQGTGVVKRFEDVVVYRRAPAARFKAASINVCERTTRRSSRLTYEGYYFDFAGRRALAARGRFVAWAQIIRDDGIDGDVGIIDISARDVRSAGGELALSARSNGLRYACFSGLCSSAQAVSQIVIAPDRSVVWIACDLARASDSEREAEDECAAGARSVWLAPPGYGVRRPSATGPMRELARGATIASRSLRLSADGRSISWRQRGARRTARLTSSGA